jgi:hypothetical protein
MDTTCNGEQNNGHELLENFLKQEILREEKLLKKTWWIGSGLALLLTFNMWRFIAVPFNRIVLNPDNLSAYVIAQVDRRIPGIINNLETDLVGRAPELASQSADNIKVLVPLISEYGIQHVDHLVNIIQSLDRVTASVTRDFFAEHEDDLRSYVARYGREGFVEHFTDEMLNSLIARVENELGLDTALDVHSIGMLENIGQQLNYLSTKTTFNMTPAERLQRRLITSWTGFIIDATNVNAIEPLRLDVRARLQSQR